MARLRGADPGKQGLVGGLLTRLAYALTKRKVGRVVIPVQIVAHHSRILWGQAQMELSLGASRLVDAGLKNLAQLRVGDGKASARVRRCHDTNSRGGSGDVVCEAWRAVFGDTACGINRDACMGKLPGTV